MEEKKQVLFVCYGLGIGGIEKCMVNLLNALPEDRYDVDIMLMSPQYTLKPQIRRSVFFYDEFQYILYSGGALDQIRSRGGILKNGKKLLPLVLFRYLDQKGGNGWKIYKKLTKHYDIAVAYAQNGYTPYYVIDKVDADRKVLWYHNGAYTFSEAEQKKHRQYFPQFDHIVAVSSGCADMLKEKLPYVRQKIMVLHNLCDSPSILENAEKFYPESFRKGKSHIVTVGRMTKEKGALLALDACRQLREQGLDICWHWVGDGEQAEEVRAKARELGLQDVFVLEGNQDNPYPFIAASDVYVQPSYYEAYSTTVTEAKVLCRPMVVTDVGGMRDQLIHEKTALIVPIDSEKIAAATLRLLQDPALRRSFSRAQKEEAIEAGGLPQDYIQTVFA